MSHITLRKYLAKLALSRNASSLAKIELEVLRNDRRNTNSLNGLLVTTHSPIYLFKLSSYDKANIVRQGYYLLISTKILEHGHYNQQRVKLQHRLGLQRLRRTDSAQAQHHLVAHHRLELVHYLKLNRLQCLASHFEPTQHPIPH